MSNKTMGVIVGRFQTTMLHAGHKKLIAEVIKRSDITVVFLGCTGRIPDSTNPLDFKTREYMIRAEFPEVVCFPLYDQNCDPAWSEYLDSRVKTVSKSYNNLTPVLYGGRDSFIPHYTTGVFETVKLPIEEMNSGTIDRAFAATHALANYDFRAGVIYAVTRMENAKLNPESID